MSGYAKHCLSMLMTSVFVSLQVVVHVTDDNDHPPEFQFPAPYKMTVHENAALGTMVGHVKAIDNDKGSNAAFFYAITHANIGMVN